MKARPPIDGPDAEAERLLPKTRTLRDAWDDPKLTEPLPDLLEGVFVRGAVHIIFALPKVGKSLFAAFLAMACAYRLHTFAGRALVPGPVLWVDCEQGERQTLRLLRQTAISMGHDAPPPEDVHFVEHRAPISAGALMELIRRYRPVAVVVDTLGRFMPVEDSHASDEWLEKLGPYCNGIHDLEQEDPSYPGPALIFIDHARKSGGEFAQALIGSVAKQATVDALIEMRRGASSTARTLEVTSRFHGCHTVHLSFDGSTYSGSSATESPKAVGLAQEFLVLDALGTAGNALTRAEIKDSTGMSEGTVKRLLKRMVDDERLVITEGNGTKGRAQRYAPAGDHPVLLLEDDATPRAA